MFGLKNWTAVKKKNNKIKRLKAFCFHLHREFDLNMDIFTNHFYLLTNCPGTTNTSSRVASFSQIIVAGSNTSFGPWAWRVSWILHLYHTWCLFPYCIQVYVLLLPLLLKNILVAGVPHIADFDQRNTETQLKDTLEESARSSSINGAHCFNSLEPHF